VAYNGTFVGKGAIKLVGTMRLDDKRVLDFFDAQQRRDFMRAGSLIRQTARRSMRRAGKKVTLLKQRGETSTIPSRPGKPPLRWMDMPRGGGLYNTMQFAWDPKKQSVVIGPTWFGGRGRPVPGQVEAGGRSWTKNPRRRRRKIGDGGEMGYGGNGSKLAKGTQMGDIQIRYAQIRTHAQAARANRINADLYGPLKIQITAAPHPYMGPALEKSQPRVAEIMGRHGR
jgi:hypothetical protein